MRTPRIKIVSRYRRLVPIVEMIEKEAELRGIKVVGKSQDHDVTVSVGGDGTMISTVVKGKPLMTVIGGTRNYMIDIPPEKIGDAFDRLLAGKFTEERYSLLEVSYGKKRILAFNDAGITSVVPLPIGFHVAFLDTEFRVSGDGLIVSTPQGSTGWSFSSNGTRLHSRSNAFIISLLNPVMTPLKSVVIPQVPVEFTVDTEDHRDRANLVADGNIVAGLADGAKIFIRKSKKEAIVYRFFEHGRVETLLNKE